MPIIVNSNIASLNAQRNLNQSNSALASSLQKLSSGLRVNSAKDDAAGLAVSEGLSSQIRGNSQGIRNAYDGISVAQTAESALGQVGNNLQRIREISVQAANGSISDDNRSQLQKEVDQLTQANSQIIQSTNYNGTALFNGGSNTTFQVGANGSSEAQVSVTAPNLTSGSTALNGYNANANATGTIDLSNPSAALSQIQADLKQLGNSRADLGAASNRFGTAIDNLTTSSINAEASRSRIQDADYAAASAELARQQILSNSSVAVQAQANLTPQYAASLLR